MLRHIEFMRTKDRVMPILPDPEMVGSAKFWDCGFITFDGLTQLTQLHTLEILTFPDATFDVLSKLKNLRYLRIIHLPKIEAIDALGDLSDLDTLGLETLPSWDSSGKVTEVRSLDPLGHLVKLRYVQLFGVRPIDRSLHALEACKGLQSGRFSKYPKKEVERFYAETRVSNASIPEPVFATG